VVAPLQRKGPSRGSQPRITGTVEQSSAYVAAGWHHRALLQAV